MAFGVENCFEHQNSEVSESFYFLYFNLLRLMATTNDHFQLQMQNEVWRGGKLAGLVKTTKLKQIITQA